MNQQLTRTQQLRQTVDRWTNRLFLLGVHLSGISVYSNVLISAKHALTNAAINKAGSSDLAKYFAITSQNILWHLKTAFMEGLILVPSYFLWKIHLAKHFPTLYMIYIFAGLLANHLYGIIGNTRINLKLIARQKEIEANKVTVTDSEDGKDIVTQQYVNSLVIQESNTWNLSKWQNPGTGDTFLVSNCYRHKLIFIFDDKDIANEFLEEVQKLITEEINTLNDSTEKAKLYQQNFINKIGLRKLGTVTV